MELCKFKLKSFNRKDFLFYVKQQIKMLINVKQKYQQKPKQNKAKKQINSM